MSAASFRRPVNMRHVGLGLVILAVLFAAPHCGRVFGADESAENPEISEGVDLGNPSSPIQGMDSKESVEPEKSADSAEPADTATKAEAAASSDVPTQKEADKETKTEKVAEKDSDETAKKPLVIGEPLAPGMIQLVKEEILAGVKKRGTTDNLARFQSYAAGRVNASSGSHTGSELTGNCRLSWYNYMMRHLMDAPTAAERFTRELHTAICDEHAGLAKALSIIAVKMDLGERKPRKVVPVTSPEQAMEAIRQALTETQVAYAAALAPLSKSEIRELQTHLVPVMCTQNNVGHTLMNRGTGRRLCDLMEKMDRVALHSAAESLAPLSDPQLLEQLKSLPYDGNVKVPGVAGRVLARIETPSGAILVGGKEKNTYQLDQMRDVAAVIDLGGGDTFMEGTVGPDRPVLIVIDLGGNNVYRGTKPGIQGAAVLGVSMLVNVGGSNTYEAADVAQGSCVAGVGILVDFGPGNRYRGVRRVQGQALGGVGILIGRGGKNDYHAALWAQGMGHPLGFGLLDNVVGDNHYYCGGMWRNSYYPETPGYEGWGQGVGAGIRQVASGGIGVILDGGGENTYEFDYLAHGGGYWCGMGFARDFGGNTKRLITPKAYNGEPRAQTRFQRFGNGWGCHYAIGFCLDDAGDDLYEGTIMGTGMAWDCSMGVLCDFAGNDHYTATGGLTQGSSNQMGFGILFDYNGDDVYDGYGQGYASTSMSYHDLPSCGGNFGFLVDYGGKDTYGCKAQNSAYVQRGSTGGFLIDRPRRDEMETNVAEPTAKPKKQPETAAKPSARKAAAGS